MKRKSIGISRKLLSLALALTMSLGTVATTYGETRSLNDSQITMEREGAWLETAYIEWAPVEGAVGYNAYVKSSSSDDVSYEQLDNDLIRQYPSYWRADALGLKAGQYQMKVEAILEDGSIVDAATNSMDVAAHDRSGFAFSSESDYKTGSGAYNDDGTLAKDAQVIYVTSETARTVELDVKVDNKNKTQKAVGIGEIVNLRQKGYDKTPLTIRFVGQITASDMAGQLNSNGYLEVKGKAAYTEMNISLEGLGNDAYASGWGFLIRNGGNVEVRNMGIMLFPDDGVSLDTTNCNVWIHNNDFFYGTAGGDSDQAKGDGSADIKGKSTYVSFSYNHFWDAGKTSLCGMKDTEEFFVTYHHNWFDHSDSRHPRIRAASVHIYNNYFDGISKYGVGTTMGSSAFVEANDFRNAKFPMLTSKQGTDALGQDIFSKEDGGMIKAFNNHITGAASLVYANSDLGTLPANATEFDAYLASTRDEVVPASYKTVAGDTAYNNFERNRDLGVKLSAIDPVERVREIVTQNAGRLDGGDFTWEFDNSVDDTSYAVNQGLMAKIRSYSTELVSVGGSSVGKPADPVIPVDPVDPVDPVEPPAVGESFVHNFTEDGIISDRLMINGSLSTSKGEVLYKGLTLTQCLKMEGSTEIKFTTNKPSTVTLVFSDKDIKDGKEGMKVVVNGNKTDYVTTDKGILVLELEAGDHTIKKGDTAHLFYMEVAYEATADPEEPAAETSFVHNFTEQDTESDFYSIKGNLSTDKETVDYNGLNLTRCLKVESSSKTTISFTTTKKSTLKLVFDSISKNIKINDKKHAFDNNVFVLELEAGNYTITKADEANLYYMEVAYDESVDPVDPVDPPEPAVPVAPSIEDITSMGTATNLFGKEDSYFTNAVYVGPNGTPTGNGEKENPLDLISAIEAVKSLDGATILLMEGSYEFDHQLDIDFENNGTAQSYKVLKASKGAEVILDFSGQEYLNETSLNARGIQLDGSYWYLEGMTIYGAADNGIMVSGSHNIVENCVLDSNRDTGLQISRRNAQVSNYADWPAYNHIINTTSKNNCDPATYENADGFAAKLTCGDGNVFDGCIAYNNSDDGWDLYAKEATGPIGIVTIKNSIAMRSGITEEGITDPSCDGNGFKLGGGGVGTPHIVINCLAIENLYNGFTDNNNPSALALKNVTAFENNQGNKKNNFSVYRCLDGYVANAITYTTSGTSDKYVNLNAEYTVLYNNKKWYGVEKLQVMDTGKSAQRGTELSAGITASDFINATVPAVGTDFHKAWRNADGTINTNGVGIIAPTSNYATFSTDGDIIGARFSANNNRTVTKVNIDSSQVEIPEEEVEIPVASVAEVIVSPSKTSVQVGNSQQFEAELIVENDADQSVTWAVTGASDSLITADGLLEVGSEETAAKLTIIATSTFDETKEGKAEVTVTQLPIIYHTVRVNAVPKEGGAVSGGGEVAKGGNSNILAKANDGYIFSKWIDNDSHNEYTSSASISLNIQSDRDFTAVFEPVVIENHRITASAGTGGAISPSGDVSVKERDNKTFTIKPTSGYYISDLIVDTKSIGAKNTYTFSNVIQDHTIKAVFNKYAAAEEEEEEDNDDREDVKEDVKDKDSENNTGSKEPEAPILTKPVVEVIDAKEVSKTVEAAIESGKTPSILIPKNGGMFEISKETTAKLKASNNGLVIKGVSTQISLTGKALKDLGDTTVSVGLSNLVEKSYEEVKAVVAKEKHTSLIGDASLTTELSFTSDGKSVERLSERLAIEIDLSDQLKQIKDSSKLTVARVIEVNGETKLIKIGGEYNSQAQTFTAYSDQVGKYILIECDNIKKINLAIDNNVSTINGTAKTNDVAPVIIKDTTMMPLRFITENLGGSIVWDPKTQEITLNIDGTEFKMQVGVEIEGYDISPVIQNGRTLVPLRYISEAIGANVTWVPSTKAIEIVR